MGPDSPEPAIHLSEHFKLCSPVLGIVALQLRVPIIGRRRSWPLPFRADGKVSSGAGTPRKQRSGNWSVIRTPRTGTGFRAISDADRGLDCYTSALFAPSRMAKRGVSRADAGLGIPWEIQRERCPRVPTGFYLRDVQHLEL